MKGKNKSIQNVTFGFFLYFWCKYDKLIFLKFIFALGPYFTYQTYKDSVENRATKVTNISQLIVRKLNIFCMSMCVLIPLTLMEPIKASFIQKKLIQNLVNVMT